MKIEYLKHKDIDKSKWDTCLLNSVNGLIYANSWYLDLVSPEWEALVCEDYKAIFPLPVRKKLGISYLAHPLFAQQLGLFYTADSTFLADDFIRAIPTKCKLKHLRLNHGSMPVHFKCSKRKNYILDLQNKEKIEEQFNQNTKRNLKKAGALNLAVSEDVDIHEFIHLKRANSKVMLGNSEWQKMAALIGEIRKQGAGFFKGISVEGNLVSAVFFTHWKNRICYLFSASSDEGKDLGASFILVHDVLMQFKDSGKILDFEGSMDANVARFFQGFGAKEEVYFELKKWF